MRRFFNILIFLCFAAGILGSAYVSDASEYLQQKKPGAQAATFQAVSNDTVEKTAPSRPPETSAFEEYAAEKKQPIKQFGYDLFAGVPSTFAPVDTVPVGPEYILGPGDQLRITLWGKISTEFTATLDREGKINFPQAGVIHLAGLSFVEAKSLLELELSRYYKPSEVKMNVSTGSLRSMRVFVVGKALRPGSYTLSSLSTLINALFAAGGPSKVGSMRDIQVKRGGKTLVRFDMYDLLLKGDKTNDIRLQPEDVIFIPPAGPMAGISGFVKSPAIYELKNESTVEDLIAMAGGLDDMAFKGRLRIDRIVDNNRDIIIESTLEDPSTGKTPIRAGDLLEVFPIVNATGFVRLSGAVHREGEYGVGAGMRVKDLIEMAGGLKYFAYTEEAEITRVNVTQDGPVTEKIKIDLKAALKGDPQNNIELKKDDFILVRPVPEWDLYRTVSVTGEVRFPGTYTVLKGETISSLLERAGGFTKDAYLKGAVFTRESVRELQQKQLDEAISRLETELLTQSAKTVQAALTPDDVKQQEVVLAQRRALLTKMKSARALGRIAIRLAPLDKFKGSASDLVLEKGDSLTIPETPAQVQVVGSVYNQTAFVYKSTSTVSNYLKKAGGLTRNADEDELYVLKVDGTAVSRRMDSGTWFSNRWDTENEQWVGGSFMSSKLDPGDTIVVPEKIETIAWLREVKDLTQILYQIAVTAGVLIVAF